MRLPYRLDVHVMWPAEVWCSYAAVLLQRRHKAVYQAVAWLLRLRALAKRGFLLINANNRDRISGQPTAKDLTCCISLHVAQWGPQSHQHNSFLVQPPAATKPTGLTSRISSGKSRASAVAVASASGASCVRHTKAPDKPWRVDCCCSRTAACWSRGSACT